MAKTDYLAHDDEGRAEGFILFRDNIGSFLVPLGILPADADIVQQAADATRFRAMVDFQNTMQQAAQAWTAEKNFERDGAGTAPASVTVPVLPANFPAAVPAGIVPRFRRLVKRLNANSKFTDAMAQALGVRGAEQVRPGHDQHPAGHRSKHRRRPCGSGLGLGRLRELSGHVPHPSGSRRRQRF